MNTAERVHVFKPGFRNIKDLLRQLSDDFTNHYLYNPSDKGRSIWTKWKVNGFEKAVDKFALGNITLAPEVARNLRDMSNKEAMSLILESIRREIPYLTTHYDIELIEEGRDIGYYELSRRPKESERNTTKVVTASQKNSSSDNGNPKINHNKPVLSDKNDDERAKDDGWQVPKTSYADKVVGKGYGKDPTISNANNSKDTNRTARKNQFEKLFEHLNDVDDKSVLDKVNDKDSMSPCSSISDAVETELIRKANTKMANSKKLLSKQLFKPLTEKDVITIQSAIFNNTVDEVDTNVLCNWIESKFSELEHSTRLLDEKLLEDKSIIETAKISTNEILNQHKHCLNNDFKVIEASVNDMKSDIDSTLANINEKRNNFHSAVINERNNAVKLINEAESSSIQFINEQGNNKIKQVETLLDVLTSATKAAESERIMAQNHQQNITTCIKKLNDNIMDSYDKYEDDLAEINDRCKTTITDWLHQQMEVYENGDVLEKIVSKYNDIRELSFDCTLRWDKLEKDMSKTSDDIFMERAYLESIKTTLEQQVKDCNTLRENLRFDYEKIDKARQSLATEMVELLKLRKKHGDKMDQAKTEEQFQEELQDMRKELIELRQELNAFKSNQSQNNAFEFASPLDEHEPLTQEPVRSSQISNDEDSVLSKASYIAASPHETKESIATRFNNLKARAKDVFHIRGQPYPIGMAVNFRNNTLWNVNGIITEHHTIKGQWCYDLLTAKGGEIHLAEHKYCSPMDVDENNEQSPPLPTPKRNDRFAAARERYENGTLFENLPPEPHSLQSPNSNTSSNASSIRALQDNEFIYPIDDGNNVIKKVDNFALSKYSKHLNTIMLKGDSPEHYQLFYNTLHNKLDQFGILLKAYEDLTLESSIERITDENCKNFTKARKAMSRALFEFIDTFKDQIFANHKKLIATLTTFEPTCDGFGFLKRIITKTHPNMQAAVVNYDPSDDVNVERPQWKNFNTPNQYINAYTTWIANEKLRGRDWSKLEQIKHIISSFNNDDRFEPAVSKMLYYLKDTYIDPKNPKPFPPALLVNAELALRIEDWIPGADNIDLTNPKHNRVVHKMGKYSNNKPTEKEVFDDVLEWKVVPGPCAVCSSTSHNIYQTGCPEFARYAICSEFEAKHKNDPALEKIKNNYKAYMKSRTKLQNERKQSNKRIIKRLAQEYNEDDTQKQMQLLVDEFNEEFPDFKISDVGAFIDSDESQEL